jgi:Spy/CpxP family protein refolding chaperone
MKRIIIISVSVVCVALIGLAVAGGPGGGGWHRSPEEKIAYLKSKIAEKLELNEMQKTTLDRIAEEMLDEHAQWSGTREAFKTSFMETLAKESVSSEEIKALFETKRPVLEEMMELAAVHIAEFHSVLTPEQRTTLIAEMESHQGGRCRFMR